MKYEYKVVVRVAAYKDGELENTLNQIAAEGWRLVASNLSPIGTSGWTLVFERPGQE
jgi:Domain of unknown function (DUF4177)